MIADKAKIPRSVAESLTALLDECGYEPIDVVWAVAQKLVGEEVREMELNDKARDIAQVIRAEGVTDDDLLRAVVIGYKIELSPEEKVRRYYESLNNGSYCTGNSRAAVRSTLGILGVEVPGVNAPDEGKDGGAV